ncbi:hypothetical protein EZS27_019386 [termite gut metagenome]|uniref:Uncharacterized protein n=1 Tax=termite gut metagenome TaxID=433724 RepID=A0A5J4REJ9_9ZZZZ
MKEIFIFDIIYNGLMHKRNESLNFYSLISFNFKQ